MNDVANPVSIKVSALYPVIKQVNHADIVERLALALIEDLKKLCEVYKEIGENEIRNNPPFGIRTAVSWVMDGPYEGTYVSVGLGEGWLNFGFLAEPVVEYLRKYFSKRATFPSATSTSQYNTLTSTINASYTKFITDDGTFLIDYTYTWFIGRRVD